MQYTFNTIRSGAAKVCSQAKFVHINTKNIENIIPHLAQVSTAPWFDSMPLKLENQSFEQALRFAVLFNVSSFCYWPKPRWRLNFDGQELGGAFSLTTCYAQEINKNPNFLLPSEWASLDVDLYKRITTVQSCYNIPLIEERVNAIKSIGAFFDKNYQGSVIRFLETVNYDAEKILSILPQAIYGFDDISQYNDADILFLKRTQLLLADISALCVRYLGKALLNAELITACPDYKLPQIMRHYGLISYEESLAKKIDSEENLLSDSLEEVEIRSATIHVIELLKDKINKTRLLKVTSSQISDQIWLLSQGDIENIKPYHRSITTAY